MRELNNDRWLSIDFLRGLSVVGMLLVINPGAWDLRYDWLIHADWVGLAVADMIFPTFLFCVGMSLPLSLIKRLDAGYGSSRLYQQVIVRSFALVCIGIILNAFPTFDITSLRIPGVLQRIGLCYAICACILLLLFRNNRSPILQLTLTSFGVLLAYWLLLEFFSNSSTAAYSSVDSLPAIVDRGIFGVQHLWPYGTALGRVTYDPEGVLSTLPACANVLFGAITTLYMRGHVLNRSYLSPFVAGVVFMLLGYLVGIWNPIIKKIWTSSFALFSTGVSLFLFSAIQFITRSIESNKATFFVGVFGSNALLAFIIAGIIGPLMDIPLWQRSLRQVGFEYVSVFVKEPQLASFVFSLLVLGVIFFVLRICYKKGLLIRL